MMEDAFEDPAVAGDLVHRKRLENPFGFLLTKPNGHVNSF
jgi:hypothetical protein